MKSSNSLVASIGLTSAGLIAADSEDPDVALNITELYRAQAQSLESKARQAMLKPAKPVGQIDDYEEIDLSVWWS